MTAPRLATSHPAALTGRVGQGGDNRIHDVALVQALLGARRDKRARPYLRGDHVTGRYDRATAEALMRYRLDQRDMNIKQPLARSGPMLNRLAQGQSLAVLEGTATPYKLATLAEPGAIEGGIAGLLSAERKVALKAAMKAFIQDWGIALDVEIKVATNNLPARTGKLLGDYNSLPLVAHFTARNLWVHNGRALSSVPSNAQFRARAKALYEAVEADLKARCVEAFGIKDPVDVKIQNGLTHDLACVVRTDLEGVEALAQFYLADWRKKGFTLAVRFLENYLRANRNELTLTRDEALAFDDVREAVAVNIERFWQDNLVEPKSKEPGANDAVEAITKNPQEKVRKFEDRWVRGVPSRAFENWAKSKLGIAVDSQSGSIGFGAGGSNVTSSGEILLQRNGAQIAVTISVIHVWSDPGFDFNKGQPFYEESLVLERHNMAKPFPWKAEWQDVITGELLIENAHTPNPTRRRLGAEARPLVSNVLP